MKLSVETFHPQRRFGDKPGLKMIRDAGFDAVDYSFYYQDKSPFFEESSIAYAREIRAYMDEIGLECVQAHAPFSLEYGEPWELSHFPYGSIVKSMEAAAILGAESIVVHAVTVRDQSAQAVEDYNYGFYKTLEPYAEQYGIPIAVENLFNTDKKRNAFFNRRCGTPESLNRLLNRLDSPWFTACIDLGHASLTGYEPEEFLRETEARFITALHVQDTDYRGDRHQLPFICGLNWEEIMKTLKQIGYSGAFNYELYSYLGKMPTPLFPDALAFACKVGRYLISLYEEA